MGISEFVFTLYCSLPSAGWIFLLGTRACENLPSISCAVSFLLFCDVVDEMAHKDYYCHICEYL